MDIQDIQDKNQDQDKCPSFRAMAMDPYARRPRNINRTTAFRWCLIELSTQSDAQWGLLALSLVFSTTAELPADPQAEFESAVVAPAAYRL